MNFAGKVVLVTGASRGIGKTIAELFAQKGATVIGTATTPQGVEKITQYISAVNGLGSGMLLDVCDEEQVNATLQNIQKEFGAPAILVNNAGVTQDNLLLRMKQEQWDRVIDTNLTAVYRLTKACLRGMMKARWGRVINITSVVGVTGNPGQANYCASKAGVIGFTKAVAQEMAKVGITANAVAPGFIQTDMTERLDDSQKEAILAQIPSGTMGEPEDIAQTVCFLASDEARYITGQTVHVNGGMCMV